jgi:hypothetical protein
MPGLRNNRSKIMMIIECRAARRRSTRRLASRDAAVVPTPAHSQ